MIRPSTEKSRHARTVTRCLPNPIDWTPIDRGLFLTAICLAVSAGNVAFLSGLGYSEIADQLNPALYRPSIWIAVILTVAAAMLFMVGLSARQRIDNWPLLSGLLAQGYTLEALLRDVRSPMTSRDSPTAGTFSSTLKPSACVRIARADPSVS